MADDLAIGRTLRAARVRHRWRQQDLADASGLPRSLISEIESGRLDPCSIEHLRAVAALVELRMSIELRPARGKLDVLSDPAHASLVEGIVAVLSNLGWQVDVEVSSTAGSIDVLAFHPGTRLVLVVEVKSRLVNVQETLRELAGRVRAARYVARQRGWDGVAVARLLVIGDTSTQRRIVSRHASSMRAAFPMRGRDVRRWLASPLAPGRRDPVPSALLFLPYVARADVIQAVAIRVRYGRAEKRPAPPVSRSA